MKVEKKKWMEYQRALGRYQNPEEHSIGPLFFIPFVLFLHIFSPHCVFFFNNYRIFWFLFYLLLIFVITLKTTKHILYLLQQTLNDYSIVDWIMLEAIKSLIPFPLVAFWLLFCYRRCKRYSYISYKPLVVFYLLILGLLIPSCTPLFSAGWFFFSLRNSLYYFL